MPRSASGEIEPDGLGRSERRLLSGPAFRHKMAAWAEVARCGCST